VTRADRWGELFSEAAEDTRVAIDAAGELSAHTADASGLAVRVIGLGSALFAHTSSTLPHGLAELIREAADQLEGTDWLAGLAAVDPAAGAPPPVTDLSSIVAVLQLARQAALDHGASVAAARLNLRSRAYCTRNSLGDTATGRSQHGRLTVTAQAGTGNGLWSATVGSAAAAATLARSAGVAAAEQAQRLDRAPGAPNGSYDTIFDPAAASVLVHELIGHSLEADTAHRGSALWRARAAFQAGLPIEVWDGPPTGTELAGTDDEGSPIRRATLIEDGRVVGLVTDRRTATSPAELTGHGRRERFSAPVLPRVRHTVLAAGPDDRAQVISRTSNGILVEHVYGADAVPGRGSFIMRVREGRRISNGELGQTIRDFTLLGDLDSLRRLDAVCGDELTGSSMCGKADYWLPVTHSSPTVRVPQLRVLG
jgi:TldD protein